MDIKERENIIQNAPILGTKRDEIMCLLHNNPSLSLRCPNCNTKLRVISEESHFQIWCLCGFMNLIEKGI